MSAPCKECGREFGQHAVACPLYATSEQRRGILAALRRVGAEKDAPTDICGWCRYRLPDHAPDCRAATVKVLDHEGPLPSAASDIFPPLPSGGARYLDAEHLTLDPILSSTAPTVPDGVTCVHCRWWLPARTTAADPIGELRPRAWGGQCRRHAPPGPVHDDGRRHEVWPHTEHHALCGDWEAIPPIQAQIEELPEHLPRASHR